jgi:RNA polymerase sigma-70 factor (ECF subfamily)
MVRPSPTLVVRNANPQRRQTATELFEEHANFVAKFLWRMGAPATDIEDLVQDVFLIAHMRGGFVEEEARATTWLCSIAFRVWSSERRRFRRHSELLNDSALAKAPATGPSPIEELDNAESLRRVRTVLEKIDEPSRAIMILVDLEGTPCVEVAHALGIPLGTVYSRLHRARKRFAKAYERLSKARGRLASHGN